MGFKFDRKKNLRWIKLKEKTNLKNNLKQNKRQSNERGLKLKVKKI
jgi:frataxin-like iron-binding protein CyaY